MEIRPQIKEESIINVSPSLEGEDWDPSIIFEVKDNSFCATIPQRKRTSYSKKTSQPIRVNLPTRQGLFLFNCQVVTVSGDSVPFVELEYPQEIIRWERRAYTRHPIRLEVHYSQIQGIEDETPFIRSYSLDISGGGLCLEINRKCSKETLLRLKFRIPISGKDEELALTGRVVRIHPTENSIAGKAGVEFIDIDSSQREAILQFVSEQATEGATAAESTEEAG
jgi:c-di-GMP-binding flagellar brake protein YcgR